MHHALFDLLRSALIPELGSDIAAGSSRDIHRILIAVSAVRAFPYELAVLVGHDLDLSVITAFLAVIALGIQLSVHDVVIDELHHIEYRRNIILHIRNFHIAYRATRGKRLELRLEFQLGKRVDLFLYVYMVAIGNVVFVRHVLDDAKTLL